MYNHVKLFTGLTKIETTAAMHNNSLHACTIGLRS